MDDTKDTLRAEFIGGLRWHVALPDPPVSECLELITAARSGDRAAQRRCEELYLPSKLIPRRPKKSPKKVPPAKKPAKRPSARRKPAKR